MLSRVVDDLGELRGALRVDEIHALEVEHDGVHPVASLRERADPLLERVAVAKNRPPSRRTTTMPGNVSSPGFSIRSRNTCVPGSRPSSGMPGAVAT